MLGSLPPNASSADLAAARRQRETSREIVEPIGHHCAPIPLSSAVNAKRLKATMAEAISGNNSKSRVSLPLCEVLRDDQAQQHRSECCDCRYHIEHGANQCPLQAGVSI
jgi:hypothetical protein